MNEGVFVMPIHKFVSLNVTQFKCDPGITLEKLCSICCFVKLVWLTIVTVKL